MPAEKATLYIKGDRDVEVTKKDITLGDILTMECGDRTVIPKIKALKLMKVPQQGKQRFVVSVLKIISCIHEKYPNIEVQIWERRILSLLTRIRRLPQSSGIF